ncbi:MAG: hypothetical protein EHM45_05110 [Desulfobacteraceae bacterium]|nr:MAG: hypothetical protein EHM45_05110 [Desulfobacteraceae bacterium]
MLFITALQDARFYNPVYGTGVLKQGQTYYAFGQFGREAAERGLARLLETPPHAIVRFSPDHLTGPDRPRRILLMFAGGWGDAVTVGIVLPTVMAQHDLQIDLCCDQKKWDFIFRPMGLQSRYVPFPPDLDALAPYEAVLGDITDFFPNKEGLTVSPIKQLMRGFQLQEPLVPAVYRIPPETAGNRLLPPTKRKRLGLNLDSNGRVKSYPLKLYAPLFSALKSLDSELHLFGNRSPTPDWNHDQGVYDWRGKTDIPELAALLSQMDLVAGVDSFVVHLGDLLGRPVLVLLATTTSAYFSRHGRMVCMPSPLECAPCFAFSNQCPRGYPDCKAFEHPGIHPRLIAQKIRSLLYDERA